MYPEEGRFASKLRNELRRMSDQSFIRRSSNRSPSPSTPAVSVSGPFSLGSVPVLPPEQKVVLGYTPLSKTRSETYDLCLEW